MNLRTLTLIATVAASAIAAHAFPIAVAGSEGFKVYVGSTDDIIATYEGNSASYSNDLYLVNTGAFIFNNHASPVGSTVNLGSFAVGTELVFKLHVNNTGYDFYTGDASLNPDSHTHARVQTEWMPDTTLVSFEDLLGGPFDFNDLSFSFLNTVGGTEPPPPPTHTVPDGLSTGGALLAALALMSRFVRSRRA